VREDHPLLTPDGTEISGQELKRVAHLAKNDLYLFAKGVLGYDRLTRRVHADPCRFLEREGVPHRRLLLMPRDHYKTTICTIADTIRRIVKRPEIRILIGNESGENACLMLAEIKRHFERNRRFRAMYPYVIPENFGKTIWSKDAILVPREGYAREPTVSAIGTSGAVVSRHFNLLKLDDIIGKEAMESPSVMTKSINWLNQTVSLLEVPKEDEIHMVGTRWSFDDAYQHAMDNMGFETMIRKAVVQGPDGPEPLFPELVDMDFLLKILETDPEHFATQYANDPLDASTQDFRKEWLIHYRFAPDGDIRYTDVTGQLCYQSVRDLDVYCHVDPSLGENSTSDPSGLVVVGVASGPTIFILEAWKRRANPLALIERMFQVQEDWAPRMFTIEHVAYQKSLQYYMQHEARRRGKYLRVEPAKPPRNKSKGARIRGRLQPLWSAGHIITNPGHVDLIEEFLKFGHTKEEHLLDALAQGPEFWNVPADMLAVRRVERIRRSLERDQGMTGYGV
jgi:hypothetical protein